MNDWEVLSGGEPLSVTIAVNDAVAGPAGGAYEKTRVVGLIVAPAAAPGPRLARHAVGGNNPLFPPLGCSISPSVQSGSAPSANNGADSPIGLSSRAKSVNTALPP